MIFVLGMGYRAVQDMLTEDIPVDMRVSLVAYDSCKHCIRRVLILL